MGRQAASPRPESVNPAPVRPAPVGRRRRWLRAARRYVAEDGERGSASVEAAIAVCALVVVLAMAVCGVATVLAQLRCADAASQAARLAARGDQQRAEQVAGRLAPSGARMDIRVTGDEVIVVVSAEPVGGRLPGITVRAEAMAVLEPGVAGSG